MTRSKRGVSKILAKKKTEGELAKEEQPGRAPTGTPPPTVQEKPKEENHGKQDVVDKVLGRMPKWFTPYGFLRLDFIYNSSRMNHPQFAQWVQSEDVDAGFLRNQRELTIYGRETRLGFWLGPFELSQRPERTWSVTGRVEVDFTAGGRESRAFNMMRLAYIQLDHKWLSLLVGQTWDPISPLNTAVNWDGGQWNVGNLGDRRAQIMLTAKPAIGSGHGRFTLSLGETNAVDDKDLDENGRRDGLDAAIPMVQAAAGYEGGLWTERKFEGGVAGHFAQEKVYAEPEGNGVFDETTRFNAWSLNAYTVLPLTERFWLSAEGFLGENLSDVRGGIGQGINLAKRREIFSTGGWIEASADLTPWLDAFAGVSFDNPKTSDLSDEDRRFNGNVWVAASFRPLRRLEFMAEYFYWLTKYRGLAAGTAHRIDLWASLHF